MFCVGICKGMDSSYVVFWFCGWSNEYFGFSDIVEDELGYGEGDDWELVEV